MLLRCYIINGIYLGLSEVQYNLIITLSLGTIKAEQVLS